MQLLSEEYDLRNNREQFLYRKEQDALAQSNWQQEFERQKYQDDRNYDYQLSRDKVSDRQWKDTFNYQKSRDKVSDSHWQKEYELSKKAKASSSRRSGSSRRSSSTKKSSKKSSSGSTSINLDDGKTNKSEYTPKEIIANIKNIQGPGVTNSIKDGISGKTFKSVDELLNYYGYAGVND